MSPLDENHQALLIRLYRLAGDDDAAERQFAACTALFEQRARRAPRARRACRRAVPPGPTRARRRTTPRSRRSIEAGTAAVARRRHRGRRPVAADRHPARRRRARRPALRVRSRLVLAEALIHALGGLDEEGLASLYEADEIAVAHG